MREPTVNLRLPLPLISYQPSPFGVGVVIGPHLRQYLRFSFIFWLVSCGKKMTVHIFFPVNRPRSLLLCYTGIDKITGKQWRTSKV